MLKTVKVTQHIQYLACPYCGQTEKGFASYNPVNTKHGTGWQMWKPDGMPIGLWFGEIHPQRAYSSVTPDFNEYSTFYKSEFHLCLGCHEAITCQNWPRK